MYKRFITRSEFNSYEDYKQNFKITVPENFNFAYDVVDVIAKETPERPALVWCNDKGDEKTINFKEMEQYSNKAANFFSSLGIKKGDKVMLILKRRYEFWYALLALHKIGAVGIPATHQLTSKDIIYRCNAADIKLIISVAEEEVVKHINDAQGKSQLFPKIKIQVVNRTSSQIIGALKNGLIDFGIATLPVNENGFNIIDFIEVEDIFVASYRYKDLKGKKISLSELIKYPLLTLPRNSTTRVNLDSFLKTMNLSITPEIVLESVDLLIEFAKIGLGVSHVLKVSAFEAIEGQELFEVLTKETLPLRKLGIISIENVPMSNAANKFINHLCRK